MKKKLALCLMLSGILCIASVSSVSAAELNELSMTRAELDSATPAVEQPNKEMDGMYAMTRTSNDRSLRIPGGKGTITSNSWHSWFPKSAGNSYQWDYQVSAVYTGSRVVTAIRTTWKGSASLRNSASINLGVSSSGGSAGGGSSWQYINTVSKYWENSNGAKTSSYRSNMVVAPSMDYRSGSISLINTATVRIKGDAMPYDITSSC